MANVSKRTDMKMVHWAMGAMGHLGNGEILEEARDGTDSDGREKEKV